MLLTKSERVRVIQQVSGILAEQDWIDIDLVLRSFGFPTEDSWHGNPKSYVVSMIGNGSDDDLIPLARHFSVEVSAGSRPTDSTSGPPRNGNCDLLEVFISHASESSKKAAALQQALVNFGMKGFVAHNDISPTVEWQIEIEKALSSCDLLVALIDPGFVTSEWCDQEVGQALGRGVPVFPVRFGVAPHGFLGRIQAFNGAAKGADQIAKELFDAALIHDKLQKRMSDMLVSLFIASDSFANAKARVAYIEQLPIWDSSYSARLREALSSNFQIRNSFGVPERVAQLLRSRG